jgi:hypothetical protein
MATFQYIVSQSYRNHKSEKLNGCLTIKKIEKTLTKQRDLIYNGFLQVMACFNKLCLCRYN